MLLGQRSATGVKEYWQDFGCKRDDGELVLDVSYREFTVETGSLMCNLPCCDGTLIHALDVDGEDRDQWRNDDPLTLVLAGSDCRGESHIDNPLVRLRTSPVIMVSSATF